MDKAMASLSGNAPLVKLHFEINEEVERTDPVSSLAESTGSSLTKEGAMSLMVARLLQCSTNCINMAMAEEWFRSQQKEEKLVTVNFEIAGGVNLKMPSLSKKKRVPSEEALELVVDKMKVDDLTIKSQMAHTRSLSDVSIAQAECTTTDDRLRRLLKRQHQANDVYGERWHLPRGPLQRVA